MQGEGLGGKQISQVRGFRRSASAPAAASADPSNRRISLIVQYLVADSAPVPLPNGLTLSNTVKSSN